MNISKALLKGSTLRFLTLVSNIGIGFYMMPFLIHNLGDVQYGIWILVGTIVGFYGLLDFGMGAAVIRFIVRAMHGKEKNEVNRALSNAVFLFSGIGLLSLIITVAVIFFVPMIMGNDENVLLVQTIVAILGIKVAIVFPFTTFRGVLTSKYRFDLLSYIQLASLLMRTAVIIYFISDGAGIMSLAIIMATASLFESFAIILMAKKLMPELRVSRSLINIGILKEYFHYGKYTYISAIADKLRFSIDDFVVAGIIGLAAVTHYTIAVTLLKYFTQTMGSIFGVIAPVLNKYHKLEQWDKLRNVFKAVTELTSIAAILFGGLLITLGEQFISIWMGDEYDDVYPAIVILTVAAVVAGAQRPSVAILYAIAKHKYYANITIIEAFANLVLSIVLASKIGIYGVALGTAIPLLVSKLIFQPAYTCKQLDISLKSYYYSISKFFVSGFLMFFIMYILINNIEVVSYFDLLVIGALETIVYVVISIRFLISDNATAYLKNVVPGRAAFLLRNVPG
ncbi:MAG: oligosaccharide flippase family protein [Methylococcales bacterium]